MKKMKSVQFNQKINMLPCLDLLSLYFEVNINLFLLKHLFAFLI